jgi:hypothetical protein
MLLAPDAPDIAVLVHNRRDQDFSSNRGVSLQDFNARTQNGTNGLEIVQIVLAPPIYVVRGCAEKIDADIRVAVALMIATDATSI